MTPPPHIQGGDAPLPAGKPFSGWKEKESLTVFYGMLSKTRTRSSSAKNKSIKIADAEAVRGLGTPQGRRPTINMLLLILTHNPQFSLFSKEIRVMSGVGLQQSWLLIRLPGADQLCCYPVVMSSWRKSVWGRSFTRLEDSLASELLYHSAHSHFSTLF